MDKLGRAERFKRQALILSFGGVVVLLLSGVRGAASQQTPAAAPPPATPAPARTKAAAPGPTVPAAPQGIALADIATQATEVSKLLSGLTTDATTSAQIEAISRSLPDLSKQVDAQIAATKIDLETEPTLETLQQMQQQWQSRQMEATASLNLLTRHATRLHDQLTQLAALEKIWSTTRTSAQASNAPELILQQIDASLAAIAAAMVTLHAERTTVLDLQSRVAQEVTKCSTALAQIGQFQQKAVAGIFVPDAPPIWSVDLWSDALDALGAHAREVAVGYWSETVHYARAPHQGGALHAALFLVLALLFCAARRKVDAWNRSSAPPSPVLSVFERPYSAALAITLFFATSPFFQLANPVRQLLTIVALVPMIRLARPVVTSLIASAIYAVALLFTIDTLRQAFGGVLVVDQMVLVGETLTAIIVLIWLSRRQRASETGMAESSRLIVLKLGRHILMTVLVIALLAGTAGYTRLARLLTPGIFVGGVLALVAFTYLRVGAGMVTLAFRVWPLRLLKMVEHHRKLLAQRAYVFLVWGAIFGWSARYLGYLGLLDPAWDFVQSLLAARIERGTISISLGNILEFLLTVSIAYLLSRFLRFALQEDLYPRVHLAPGLSYAASSLLNYIIIALGFVAGLGILGVDFSKVTILAGAFGVGIGFGLQSVVNNFVCGLILLFERPIHVGDMVQVGTLRGRVLRIGIRASVIRTTQGAEIIVPNAQLITEQVTNWTLSDELRRIDLPVGVSYGTAPKKVIELLESAARAHPQVLKNPAPRALFMGYGDSSINFELRAWSELANWRQVQSDLTVAVYDAVYAAGLSFPFPQREVRLLHDRRDECVTATADGDVRGKVADVTLEEESTAPRQIFKP